MKYYVSMTDDFFTDVFGKTDKYIVVCETAEQAKEIARNARKGKHMHSIIVRHGKPCYSEKKFHVSFRDYDESPIFHDKKED